VTELGALVNSMFVLRLRHTFSFSPAEKADSWELNDDHA
jgi:hypothetical protein